jgi:hypothetical protein
MLRLAYWAAGPCGWGSVMSNVVQFARPVASAEVVEELIKLGYLKGRKRRDVRAIEEALVKLHVSHSCKLCDGWRIAILDSLVAAKVLLGLFGLWPVRTLGRLG